MKTKVNDCYRTWLRPRNGSMHSEREPNPHIAFRAGAWCLLLLCVTSMTGCALAFPKALKTDRVAGRPLRVVPVAGQPVIMEHWHVGTIFLTGYLGSVVEDAAHGKSKAALAERMNRDLSDFQPECILAEECVMLLRSSPRIQFQGITLSTNSSKMEGAAELLETEPKPFKPKWLHRSDWKRIVMSWRNGPPTPLAIEADEAAGDAVVLEVAFDYVNLNHGNRLGMQALMRVVDPSEGEILGKSRYVVEVSTISSVTLTSCPQAFESDFRACANNLARRGLKYLKLL